MQSLLYGSFLSAHGFYAGLSLPEVKASLEAAAKAYRAAKEKAVKLNITGNTLQVTEKRNKN